MDSADFFFIELNVYKELKRSALKDQKISVSYFTRSSVFTFVFSLGSSFSFTENFKADSNLSSSEHVISVGFVEYDVSDSIPCHLTENLAVKENYLWMFVPFINAHDDVPRLFSYACFTESDKQVPLPFFGDNIYRVESMELNEGVLTVRNGSDKMVIRMTFDPECDPAPDTTDEEWHNVRESPFFPLSGPFSDQICDTLGPYIDFCKVAKENSCEISRAQQDFCIRLDNVGPSKRCDATMEIIEMTGIFREKSLLLSQTPVKAMESEWIRGNRSLAMITPCFK